ncbi:mitochondrial 37S ribosomal protein bS21m [Lachancea thermotolerans CBS 6340]|uniref:KLTH0C05984p n=1 Tax=Lachancea thermotolerans (strain ATCC 56472 / CBS 6340 / NRRL Y-8284) TaxID=559295 RepID=C5DE36_LACTC|nr:KLTH0C05984p [Lachancea thermotolerans CBS 6340]CAR22047.1 KLTH0C05984p [Lachancea thermotolerans CBS 6340]
MGRFHQHFVMEFIGHYSLIYILNLKNFKKWCYANTEETTTLSVSQRSKMLSSRGVRLSQSVRTISSSLRLLNSSNSPIFDPSQLNPLSNTKVGTGASSKLQFEIPSPQNSSAPQDQGQRFAAASFIASPKEDALTSRLTGVRAGRTVDVYNGDTAGAFRQLNSVVFSNRIAQDRRNQRFHLKRGKAKEIRSSQRHRREFMKGFKRLIEVVKDAKRKGY